MSYCWPHYGAQLYLNRKQRKPLLYLLLKDLLSVAFRVEQYFRQGDIFQDVLRVSASHGELSLDPCRNGDIHKLPHATMCMLLEGCPCWAWRLPYFGGHWAIGPLLHLGQLNPSCRLSKQSHACSILSSQTNVLGNSAPNGQLKSYISAVLKKL